MALTFTWSNESQYNKTQHNMESITKLYITLCPQQHTTLHSFQNISSLLTMIAIQLRNPSVDQLTALLYNLSDANC